MHNGQTIEDLVKLVERVGRWDFRCNGDERSPARGFHGTATVPFCRCIPLIAMTTLLFWREKLLVRRGCPRLRDPRSQGALGRDCG
jgi:hypothetical protein